MWLTLQNMTVSDITVNDSVADIAKYNGVTDSAEHTCVANCSVDNLADSAEYDRHCGA